MPGCCVPGCTNRGERGYRLYRFPADPERRQIWTNNVGREGWTPSRWTYVCQEHFEHDQFENRRADGRRKLRWNAVPTLFAGRTVKKIKKPPVVPKLPPPTEEHVAQSDHSYSSLEPSDKTSSVSEDSAPEGNCNQEKNESVKLEAADPQSRVPSTDAPDGTTPPDIYSQLFDVLTSLHTAVATLNTNMQNFEKRLSIIERRIGASVAVEQDKRPNTTADETSIGSADAISDTGSVCILQVTAQR